MNLNRSNICHISIINDIAQEVCWFCQQETNIACCTIENLSGFLLQTFYKLCGFCVIILCIDGSFRAVLLREIEGISRVIEPIFCILVFCNMFFAELVNNQLHDIGLQVVDVQNIDKIRFNRADHLPRSCIFFLQIKNSFAIVNQLHLVNLGILIGLHINALERIFVWAEVIAILGIH